jgi:hypothetical protein
VIILGMIAIMCNVAGEYMSINTLSKGFYGEKKELKNKITYYSGINYDANRCF